MRNIKKLLQSKCGETLIETLASILIFTLASIAMFSMCQSANRLNMKVKKHQEEFQQQIELLEQRTDSIKNADTDKIEFKIYKSKANVASGDIGYNTQVPITMYGSTDKLYTFSRNHS